MGQRLERLQRKGVRNERNAANKPAGGLGSRYRIYLGRACWLKRSIALEYHANSGKRTCYSRIIHGGLTLQLGLNEHRNPKVQDQTPDPHAKHSFHPSPGYQNTRISSKRRRPFPQSIQISKRLLHRPHRWPIPANQIDKNIILPALPQPEPAPQRTLLHRDTLIEDQRRIIRRTEDAEHARGLLALRHPDDERAVVVAAEAEGDLDDGGGARVRGPGPGEDVLRGGQGGGLVDGLETGLGDHGQVFGLVAEAGYPGSSGEVCGCCEGN